MRIVAEVLKLIGALAIASILGQPVAFPPSGPGLWLFLGTFAWPIAFALLLLWIPPGPLATFLRAVEVPLWGWTAFMIWFAAGMDPGPHVYVPVAGTTLYGVGAFLADFVTLRKREPRTA